MNKTVAIVEFNVENRRVHEFINAVDLGVSGIVNKKRVRIDYKPGEIVDEKRVLDAFNSMIEVSNKQKMEFLITDPKVISISEES